MRHGQCDTSVMSAVLQHGEHHTMTRLPLLPPPCSVMHLIRPNQGAYLTMHRIPVITSVLLLVLLLIVHSLLLYALREGNHSM